MNINNFSYNPFAMNTASNAWNDQNLPAPKRAGKAVLGAFYDIYVTNPYNLTIGNSITLAKSPDPLSTKAKVALVATIVFGTLYTLTLYGATLHLGGLGILSVSTQCHLGALSIIGEAVKEVGTKLFLAGTVPIYGTVYALPRYLIKTIPKIPAYVDAKLDALAKGIFQHVLKPFWFNVAYPALKMAYVPIKFTAVKIFDAIVYVADIAARAVVFVIEKTIFPAARAITYAVRTIETHLDTVLKALAEKIKAAAIWTFENILVPYAKQLYKELTVLSKAIWQATTFMFEKISHVAQWTFFNVIQPLWYKVVQPLAHMIKESWNITVSIIEKVALETSRKIAVAASWIFQNILIPVGKLIVTASNHLFGAAKAVASRIEQAAYWTFNHLLVPLWQRIISPAMHFVWNRAIVPIGKALASSVKKVAEAVAFIIREAVVPAAHKVVDGAVRLNGAVGERFSQVFHSVTQAWQSALS